MRLTREHIIEEIRRTTEANGGVPLGVKRFFQETGIREADWFGKYWPRWGDALREAGFAANELRGAYANDLVIGKLAALTRDIGKFPAKGDLMLKRRTDSTFPAHNVFTRLGSKSELISQVIEYCRNHEGFGDVERLCADAASTTRKTPGEERQSAGQLGFVYLIQVGRHYKIGKTNAVGRRERELAIQLPEKSRTVHAIKTDDPTGIEDYWHRRFAAKRGNGEWFELDTSDVSAFKRRKFM